MKRTKWTLDDTHSEIQFKVRHLMVTNVSGSFGKINGEVTTVLDDFQNAQVVFSADIHSLTTGSEQRDQHLKSADFFDADNFPELKFVSKEFLKKSNETYELAGDLTIKGTTKTISFEVEHGGIVKDPWGNTKAGFSFSAIINRKDFGLNWNVTTEAGGLLVSEDVKIFGEIQLLQSVPEEAAA